jgi:lipoprotein-anchoring transpeptidase ErfK/SrfK
MDSDRHIQVSISNQTLTTFEGSKPVKEYSVSTALNGVGQQFGSGCTPLGQHYIRAKIGSNAQQNAVFVGRRLTGEIYSQQLADEHPNRDWILSRIMWLSGKEVGKNRLGKVDSMARYIYIHGTPDTEPMGVAKSHGCVRMRNDEVIELFNWVPNSCPVLIEE